MKEFTAGLWLRAREALAGRVRERITWSGLGFSTACVLVGVAAFVSANNLLFLMLAAMLAALLVSGLVSRLALAGLEIEFLLPDHISARRRVTGRLLIRNAKRWTPSFSIHLTGSADTGMLSPVYFPLIPGGAVLDEPVGLVFARRGIHSDSSFQVATRFPFGFTERRVRVSVRRDVLVYPCLSPQPGLEELLGRLTGEIETYYRGRGHDFYRIRPYEPSESARHVDWKATAHTGELQVREFAREQEHLIELLLDLDAPPGLAAWFEQAVECCAYIAWRVAGRASRIHFRTQDFDLRLPEEGDIHAILKYLALTSPRRLKPPPPAGGEGSYQLAIGALPDRLREAGWSEARILGPDDFPGPLGPAENAAAPAQRLS